MELKIREVTSKVQEVVYKACIPLQPTTKKNSQQIYINARTKRPFVSQSEAYKKYERSCKEYLKTTTTTKTKISNILSDIITTPQYADTASFPISYPVNIQAIYYRGDRRRVDLPNLHEALCDILVKHGILEDDNFNIVAGMDGSKVLYDKEHPRTEITITKLEAD